MLGLYNVNNRKLGVSVVWLIKKTHMEDELKVNVVNALYFLYFENKELIHHFERIWTKDGMRYSDEEYAYIFLGCRVQGFPIELEAFYFLHEEKIIENTGGSEHDDTYVLADYFRIWLGNVLEESKGNYSKDELERAIVLSGI
jgi:hypothetical protein